MCAIGMTASTLAVAQSQDTTKTIQVTPASVASEKDESVKLQVDKQATFPGGNQNINSFIRENIVYPKEAIEQEIQGSVMVSFVINAEGDIEDVKISKSAGSILDQAAISVIKKMPKWEPAMYQNKAVKTMYTLPVNFRLQ
jgi:protein TonB